MDKNEYRSFLYKTSMAMALQEGGTIPDDALAIIDDYLKGKITDKIKTNRLLNIAKAKSPKEAKVTKNNQGVYYNSYILVNKFNVKDDSLADIEAYLTADKMFDLLWNKKLTGLLDFSYLKSLHKYIFKDIYEWAGNIRNVNISKGFQFTDVRLIMDYANDIFKKLCKDRYYQDFNKELLINKIADLYGDLNCLHPFREGNGRANKAFIQIVAGINGYLFDFSLISKEDWINASIASCYGDNNKLIHLLEKSLFVIDEEEKNRFLAMIK